MEALGEMFLWIIGIILGLIFIVGLFVSFAWLRGELEYQRLLTDCQQNLPRNEHCILQAVPQFEKGIEK